MTQREKDMHAEKELSAFLDQNFYQKRCEEGKSSAFERVQGDTPAEVALQKQGVDVIVTSGSGAEMYVDEKAQLHYINNGLPTFVVELDFLYNGEPIDGWFLNDHLRTTHYFFLWPNAATTDLATISSGDFTEVEGMMVAKADLKAYLEDRGLDYDRLKEMAQSIRESGMSGSQRIVLDGGKELWGVKLNLSTRVREQPVNLVVNKRVLRQLSCGAHYIITQQGYSRVN